MESSFDFPAERLSVKRGGGLRGDEDVVGHPGCDAALDLGAGAEAGYDVRQDVQDQGQEDGPDFPTSARPSVVEAVGSGAGCCDTGNGDGAGAGGCREECGRSPFPPRAFLAIQA